MFISFNLFLAIHLIDFQGKLIKLVGFDQPWLVLFHVCSDKN